MRAALDFSLAHAAKWTGRAPIDSPSKQEALSRPPSSRNASRLECWLECAFEVKQSLIRVLRFARVVAVPDSYSDRQEFMNSTVRRCELESGSTDSGWCSCKSSLRNKRSAWLAGMLPLTLLVSGCGGGASNVPPTADGLAVTTDEDTSAAITLRGTDTDGTIASYSVASLPSHGTLSGSEASRTYEPSPDFFGTDSFSFTVTDDDGAESQAATVNISVVSVNDLPLANASGMQTDEDVTGTVTLTGSDVEDGGNLTFSISSHPPNGSVTLMGADAQYEPDEHWNGTDSFGFTVADSEGGLSEEATVTVTVNSVNDIPVSKSDEAKTDEDTAASIELVASDVEDGTALTFVITSPPAHGAVSMSGSLATYEPDQNWHGSDSFRFTAIDDDGAESNESTIAIDVESVNDVPSAHPASVQVFEDNLVAVVLTGTDVEDGGNVGVAISSEPENGEVTLEGFVANYRPAEHWFGVDTFGFTATDAEGATSSEATVTVTVISVNDLPIAHAAEAGTDEDTEVEIHLSAEDAEDGEPTLNIASGPSDGTVVLDGTVATYEPDLDWFGDDLFKFVAEDSEGATSNVATVHITVQSVNDLPSAETATLETDEDHAGVVELVGDDVEDGSTLEFQITHPPTAGSVSVGASEATYTPMQHWFGSDSFRFVAVDTDGGQSEAAAVSITVYGVNDVPVAEGASLDSDEDSPATVELSAHDVEDGAQVILSVRAQPVNGTVLLDGTMATFSPDPDWFGTDSFGFTATDQEGAESEQAAVSITIHSVNDMPVVFAAEAETDEDTGVLIQLSGWDVEDGGELEFLLVSETLNGSVTLDGSRVEYEPAPNWFGVDQFEFSARDSDGMESEVATVTVTVESVNDLPVVDPLDLETDEDTPVSGTLTGSDVEDGSHVTFSAASAPENGSVTIEGGELTYVPREDWFGSDGLRIFAVDSDGGLSEEGQVNVTVKAVNDPPIALSADIETDEDVVASIGLSGSDPEDGDAVEFALASTPANGSASLDGDTAGYSPNSNWFGNDSFTFHAVDTEGLASDEATVNIRVASVNDLPIAHSATVQTDEDEPAIVTLSATDVEDGSIDDFVVVTEPLHGSVALEQAEATYLPDENWHGVDHFRFSAVDSEGGVSEEASVSLTVSSVNDAPVAVSIDASTEEDTEVTVTLSGSDVEDGEGVRFEVVTSPSHGTNDIDAGTVSYRPDQDWFGEDSFRYRVVDSEDLASEEATATISVASVNDVPLADSASVQTGVDETASIVLTGDDVEDAGELTFSIASEPSNGSVTLDSHIATYTPDQGWSGTDTFGFTVTDSDGAASAEALITISVDDSNHIPVADPVSAETLEDDSVAIRLSGFDHEDGDEVTYSLHSEPSNGQVTLSGFEAAYDPDEHWHGTDSFQYTVTDTEGAESEPATVTVEVQGVNDAPVASTEQVGTDEDVPVNVTLRGSDVEDGTGSLSFRIASDAAHGAVSISGSVASYEPNENWNGKDTFAFSVTDSDGAESEPAEVDVTVASVNDPPVVEPASATTDEDVAVDIGLDAADVEDGTSLTIVLFSVPSNGSLEFSGTVITYTPRSNWSGTDTFRIFVRDTEGLRSEDVSVTVTVEEVNDSPRAFSRTLTTNEDTPRTIVLSGSDAEGAIFAYKITEQPQHGWLGGVPPSIRFHPNDDFTGADSLQFVVEDADGALSEPATISIDVVGLEDVPVFEDEYFRVEPNMELTNAQLHPVGIDNEIQSIEIESDPSDGTATISGTTLSYTPDAGFEGDDEMTVHALDAGGLRSRTATLHFSVVDRTIDEDKTILSSFHDDTDGPNWTNSENWGSDLPLDDWFGITTWRGGHAGQLILSSNGLDGEMPDELVDLAHVYDLYFPANSLEGDIPAHLTAHSGFRVLDFRENELTGVVPWNVGNMSDLEWLLLSGNTLTGTVPPSVSNLGRLTHLLLDGNQLEGRPAVADWPESLQWVWLSENKFTGPVPAELGNLTRLTQLRLNGSGFTGRLPMNLINLPNLQHFQFEDATTELCAPRDPDFVAWLGAIPDSDDIYCSTPPNMSIWNDHKASHLTAGITHVAGITRIANDGDQDLAVTITTSHDWITVSESSFTVDPFRAMEVEIHVDCGQAERRKGAVTISTNDPERPTRTIRVDVECLDRDLAIEFEDLPGAGSGGPVSQSIADTMQWKMTTDTDDERGELYSFSASSQDEGVFVVQCCEQDRQPVLPNHVTTESIQGQCLSQGTTKVELTVKIGSDSASRQWTITCAPDILRVAEVEWMQGPFVAGHSYSFSGTNTTPDSTQISQDTSAVRQRRAVVSFTVAHAYPVVPEGAAARWSSGGEVVDLERASSDLGVLSLDGDLPRGYSFAFHLRAGHMTDGDAQAEIEFEIDGLASSFGVELASLAFETVHPFKPVMVPYVVKPEDGSSPDPAPDMDLDDLLEETHDWLPISEETDARQADTVYVEWDDIAGQSNHTVYILELVNDLYNAEGAEDEFYHAVLMDNINGYHCDGGAAYVSWQSAASCVEVDGSDGLTVSGQEIVAHEFGHNFSLRHAPCGVFGSSVDERYPYSGAKMGPDPGWSHVLDRFIDEDDGFVSYMSYCGPEFTSDYDYDKAVRHFLELTDTWAADAPVEEHAGAADLPRSVALMGWLNVVTGEGEIVQARHSGSRPRPSRAGPWELVAIDGVGVEAYRELTRLYQWESTSGEAETSGDVLMWAVRIPRAEEPVEEVRLLDADGFEVFRGRLEIQPVGE